jgi:hypothetical protein
VRGVDRVKRELTIAGPDNAPVALKVAPVVAGFDGIKTGDAAVVEYTNAVALSAVKHESDKPDSPRL